MLFVSIGELAFYLQNIIAQIPEGDLTTCEQLFSVEDWRDALQWLAVFMLWVGPCEEVFARGLFRGVLKIL